MTTKRFKEGMTNRETLGPAMEITDQAEADSYLADLVDFYVSMNPGKTLEECRSIALQNLGYYAGYYSHETRERVERLFRCAHPIFGPVSSGVPTPEEAFAKGVEIGSQFGKEEE